MKPKPPRSSAPSGQGGGNLDADTSLYTKSAISGVSAGGTAMQSVSTKLDEAHHAQIAYTKKIEAERRRLHETERRCERIRQSIADFRKLLGGGFQRREKGHAKSAMDSRLENQLQVLMEKHNRTRNGNLALKTQVENRRREKMQQSVVNRKIERSLERKRAELMRMIKVTAELQDERDAVQREFDKLKNIVCNDIDSFTEEMLGAQSTVHTPAAGQRSVSTFGTHESHARRADSTAGKRGGDRAKLKAPEGAPPVEEHELQQEVNKAYWVVAKTRMDLTKQIERKEELKSAFDKICDETGVNDSLSPRERERQAGAHPLYSLVPLLLKSEEENFQIFHTINELNTELEQLEGEKSSLAREMSQLRADIERSHTHQQQVMVDLGGKLDHSRNHEQKHATTHQTTETVVTGVTHLLFAMFTKIGCQDTPEGEALASQGINERNVMDYLGMVEERMTELLQLDAQIETNAGIDASSSVPSDPTRPRTPKYHKDGRRLPAMSLPQAPSTADTGEAGGGLISAAADGDDDDMAVVQPDKVLHGLKSGEQERLETTAITKKPAKNKGQGANRRVSTAGSPRSSEALPPEATPSGPSPAHTKRPSQLVPRTAPPLDS